MRKSKWKLFYIISGVTIGIGVDLKEITRSYFEGIGVSEAVINKLAPYFGLHVSYINLYILLFPWR